MEHKLKRLSVLSGIIAASLCFAACSPTGEGGGPGGSTDNKTDGSDIGVTFSAGDGAFSDSRKSVTLTPDGDGKVRMEEAPRYDGHAFVGWFNGSTEYNPNASVTSNYRATPTRFTTHYSTRIRAYQSTSICRMPNGRS